MNDNPYQSPSSSPLESTPVVPQRFTVLGEAWRGCTFGARIMAKVMVVIAALFVLAGLGILAGAVYFVIRTKGAILERVDYLEIAKGIGGSLFMLVLSTVYLCSLGGLAGGTIMATAAVFQKLRRRVQPGRERAKAPESTNLSGPSSLQ